MNDIFHSGYSLGINFRLPDGLAINMGSSFARRLDGFNLWSSAHLKRNNLGSLLPVFTLLTEDIYKTMCHLGKSICSSFPEQHAIMKSNFKIYLRSDLAKHFVLLEKYKKEHWFTPSHVWEMLQEAKP